MVYLLNDKVMAYLLLNHKELQDYYTSFKIEIIVNSKKFYKWKE